MDEKRVVGGIPIECLTGEPAAIWSGWRSLGDRELTREASAKGTHINLAHKCLAFRRNCSLENAQDYFSKEVEIWIMELLQKRQIYRASHILKNMEKDPVEYIFKVCVNSKDSVIRNYLSEYLINISCFEDNHIDSWNIIKYLEQCEEKQMIQNGVSSTLCIESMIKLPECIKEALCTELYFSINEHSLLKHITNIVLWDYLLSNNQIEMIKYWIDIQYNGNSNEQSSDIIEEHKSLFATMNIVSDMHEHIDSSNASDLVKNLIKNHLCRYGIFVQKEKENIKLMLTRIFDSAMTLSQFGTVLSLETCNINKTEFFKSVDKELCLARCLNENHTEQNQIKVVKLFDVLTRMCNNQEQFEDTLTEGLYETIHYLSDDLNEFLKQNYLIVILVIFLYLSKENVANSQSINTEVHRNILKTIFMREDNLQIAAYNISTEVLQSTLKQVPILQHIIENKPRKEATMYDLLNGYKNLNVKQLFKWRFNNEVMPHFFNETLVKKYGHTETLTYEYYLKEARPNMAIFNLKHSQRKLVKSVSSRRKYKASLYAHILALRNLEKSEIVCSCISFIEMLSVDSENLRLYVTAANYIKKKMDISIGNLLENIIYENENDLKTVILYFENCFHKDISETSVEDSQQFINMLKVWDIIVRFARSHSFTLPTSFIKFLASQNHWFEFLLVCQTFSYPMDQVLDNAKYFEDAIIREHLLTCLNNPRLTKVQSAIHTDQKVKSRDVRQSLYHKESCISGSSASIDSSSTSDSCSTYEYTINDSVFTLDDDLWLIILKCHQSPDPPGALISASLLTLKPFLTVLATCYEPSSTAAYSYSWMIISTADENIISNYKNCLEQQIWTANQVFNLLNKMVTCGYISTLSRTYKIFMPESAFNAYFEFLAQCTLYGGFEESQEYILKFKSQCLNLKCNKAIDWDCSDGSYLNNLYWVITVAVKCILATLACGLRSTHLQIEFLKTLIKCDFYADCQVHIPNFQCLLKVVQILQKTNIIFNFANYIISDDVFDFNPEIQRCIDDLLQAGSYDNALELSSAAGLNSSNIILAQYRCKFEHCMQKKDKIKNEFWIECAQNFEKHKVPHEKSVEFFIQHAEKVVSHRERYEILRLAFETLKSVDAEQQNIDTLEMAMWKSCMLADPENIQLESGPHIFNKLKTELLSGLDKLKFSYALNEPCEKSAADKLINKLIDLNKIDIALRVSAIFNYKHKDLEILMLCLSLAEGEMTPNDLTSDRKSLLKDLNKTSSSCKFQFINSYYNKLTDIRLTYFYVPVTTLTSLSETNKLKDANVQNTQIDCLTILKTLLKSLEHGQDICLRIVLYYKLAVQLGKSYCFLLMLNDPTQFLQEISESNIENKLEIFADLITAYNINNDAVATFLAENITANIGRAIEDSEEGNICLWGYSLNSDFRVIMELCNDVSLLGCQLLKRANALLGHSQCEKLSTLKLILELLIRSHDCFTTSCNMEGIASILRKCQNLVNILQNLKLWTLLARLVTGVGRFTEMNYIFQILKENHQFECLLGKGLDKIPGLKIALLEFLKRSSPEDKDLFTLVALHFQLYHEMALMWESEAKDIINTLVSEATNDHGKLQNSAQHVIKLTKTEHVQKQLQLTVSNFTYATQYYLRDKKLNIASWCSNQAQLVAFQLSLFNIVSNNQQVICILNLKSEDIDRILCHTLNFSQALIVINAYNFHVNWANLIYNHCILNGETKYLKDFIAVKKLTSSLVQDCARRYRLEKGITHTMTDNIKMLISELSDVECKYMLASQLGFKNIIESMLNDPMIGAYLKDTVWKKCYNIT
ncbi:spatacsin isoform X2 [Megalopta genalis]|uniref:spatacsin isoform X2 n=1 Tax=Megalopta genalis TaxID=115081 RepID=UPI003FD61BC6